MKIFPSQPYIKQAHKLLTEAERAIAEAAVASAPDYWPMIAGTAGAQSKDCLGRQREKRRGASDLLLEIKGRRNLYARRVRQKPEGGFKP